MARDKRKKFVDLAEKRTTKAIYALRLVGNLSNKNNYDYTDADIKKILKALEDEIRNVRRRFGEGTGSSEPVFKL
jgi:hypothetical protein